MRVLCVLFFLAVSAPIANADIVTFEFTGEVYDHDAGFANAAVGATVTGSFSYDTDDIGTVVFPEVPTFTEWGSLWNDISYTPLDITVHAFGRTFLSTALIDHAYMQHSTRIYQNSDVDFVVGDLLVLQSYGGTTAGEASFMYIGFEDHDEEAFASIPLTLPASFDLSVFERISGGVVLDGAWMGYEITSLRRKPEPVCIDVRPGETDPARLNRKGKGVVPVAILSTSEFDAADVVPQSALFGDEDHALTEPERWVLDDVDGDGDDDLVLFFRIADLVGDGSIDSDTSSVSLSALTIDGTLVAGVDTVKVK